MAPHKRRAYNTAWARARRARRTPEEHEAWKAKRRAYIAKRMLDPAYAAKAKAAKRESMLRLRRTPEYRRRLASRHLKRAYGLTIDQRDAMLARQGGGCALCGKTTPASKGWHVDHNHATNENRGILCSGCNVALGGYEKLERLVGIAKAKAYLDGWPEGDDMSAVRSA